MDGLDGCLVTSNECEYLRCFAMSRDRQSRYYCHLGILERFHAPRHRRPVLGGPHSCVLPPVLYMCYRLDANDGPIRMLDA